MKKFLVLMLVCVIGLSFSGLTMAADETKPSPVSTSDEIKWIAQCMEDNKDQAQPAEVVRKYCECMVSKMAEDETKSVTEWEKTHPDERKACDKVAGWK